MVEHDQVQSGPQMINSTPGSKMTQFKTW